MRPQEHAPPSVLAARSATVSFNSIEFLLFFSAFLALWPWARRRPNARWGYLVAASFFFYGWWDWRFLFLLAGSGLIDLIGQGRSVGLMDESGRYNPALVDRTDRLREVKTDHGSCLEYVVVPRTETENGQDDIAVDERDVATLLQAKAATYAGVVVLLKHAGLALQEIDTILGR